MLSLPRCTNLRQAGRNLECRLFNFDKSGLLLWASRLGDRPFACSGLLLDLSQVFNSHMISFLSQHLRKPGLALRHVLVLQFVIKELGPEHLESRCDMLLACVAYHAFIWVNSDLFTTPAVGTTDEATLRAIFYHNPIKTICENIRTIVLLTLAGSD